MILYPAIDLYEGKAVRLYKGDYEQMTVYSENPPEIAKDFRKAGAKRIHVVDLEGARDGNTQNLSVILKIKEETGLFLEVGGGIRSMKVIDTYLKAGIDRVILGTAAVTNPEFLKKALKKYGSRVAVGIDILNGKPAIRGWKETADEDAFSFFRRNVALGVRTFICTDITKDGAMKGTNLELYRALSETFDADIIASGGVSSMTDITELAKMNIHGAIIGKAYYTGAIDLKKAIEVTDDYEKNHSMS